MDRKEHLLTPLAYIPPERALAGLDSSHASQRVAGATHSIVEILAHMDYWQSWFLDRCTGVVRPMAARASEGWPTAEVAHWESLRDHFLGELRRASELPGDGLVVPAIEMPGMSHYTIPDALAHLAIHNAHHFGQIVMMRQLLGVWPPPDGSWTW